MPVPFIVRLLRLGNCLFDCFNFHSPYHPMQNGVICAHEQLLTVLLPASSTNAKRFNLGAHASIHIYLLYPCTPLKKFSYGKCLLCASEYFPADDEDCHFHFESNARGLGSCRDETVRHIRGGRNSTPCVAAHSLARALYNSYKGVLYTVQKADGTTFDVKVFLDPIMAV